MTDPKSSIGRRSRPHPPHPAMRTQRSSPPHQERPRHGRRRRVLHWLRWGTVALLVSLLVLDIAFPPKLPRVRDTSTLVVAADGTPLRAFADAEGVWRYPATPATVSPLYLQALLNYEDRKSTRLNSSHVKISYAV